MHFQLFLIIIIFSGCNSSYQTYRNKRIDLRDQKLSSIPDSVFNHRNLTSLDLGNSMTIYPPLSALMTGDANRISVVPEKIGELSMLRSHNLSGNLIKTLPVEMRKLKNLDSLDISFNQDINLLTELITLKSLDKLTYLNITGLLYKTEDIDLLKQILGSGVKIVETPF